MPLLALTRRALTLPRDAAMIVLRLVDDLEALHRQLAAATEELARTRRTVEAGQERLDTLVAKSDDAIARMDRANDGMDDVVALADQVPGLDPGAVST